ncbi:MAG: DNA helicase [Desulfovibrio sp. MES5]|uniref:UvrD-helicase domain-containing protein n=1 Tax=Desulfovibrio sp. MES5 TaxID=1899016 RepID=UPI000B9D3ED8|nr:UvrD-helicase domain-containing protein [Desulfovibrio sp. MES5]OXS28436.1 MAG: DNA helicase [Desulfovibrio sp. MES5]
MNFIADLHIHSRFSRATSKALNARHLAAWARCKGISVLGTGDFTHPQWRAELGEQLELDEASGLYRLKGEPEQLDVMAGGAMQGGDAQGPLFMLQAEVSSIYKRHGKVRKVHNLIFMRTLEDAARLSQRLEQIGNLHSDGRPILGLDSRDLLEIMLECAEDAVMIPAHVWTPWFALFGSKSGFDRLTDCYGDLSEHIFALETGLSSDPDMNRLVSQLDGYALVSNSDAHSGANLGREANLFDGRPSYEGMFAALRAAARRQPQDSLDCRFLGTMEFYPDEGKYHLDGHRACNVVLEPRESRALGNICPVCGKPLTVGVLHRVWELADREEPARLALEPEARPLIPLAEVVGEIVGAGVTSRKVQERYGRLLRELGPELDILCRMPEAEVRAHWEPLGEAVARMRRGQVFRQGGYDGEYGVVRVFTPEEQADIRGAGRGSLPGLKPGRPRKASGADAGANTATDVKVRQKKASSVSMLDLMKERPSQNTARQVEKQTAQQAAVGFSEEQQTALTAGPGPVLVQAGPGAGKTRVLIGRMQHLLDQGIPPDRLLAVTFTRRAANEMRQRLTAALPLMRSNLPCCDTMHGIAWGRMRAAMKAQGRECMLLGDDAAQQFFRAANPQLAVRQASELWRQLALARECQRPLDDQSAAQAATLYAQRKSERPGLLYVDYADLLDWWLEHIAAMPPDQLPQHVLVDEVQDLSPVQLAIIRRLLPGDGKGFFGIGDPDQAIYGFRGVSGQSEGSLRVVWPELSVFCLGRSFRSSQDVLNMARSLLHHKGQCGPLTAARQLSAQLRLFSAPDQQAELRWITRRVQALLGATAHTLLDQHLSSSEAHELDGTLAPGDIAVLVRLRAQIAPLRAALEQAGIPCAAPAEDAFWQDAACARLLAMVAAHCGFDPLAQSLAGANEQQEGPARATPAGTAETSISAVATSATDSPGMAELPALSAIPFAAGSSLPAPEALEPWLKRQLWAGEPLVAGRAWRDLKRAWKTHGSWPEFLGHLGWLQEAEMVRGKAEYVQIMTMHASKGLEFQAVFLPGLEDGLLPLRKDRLFAAGSNGNTAPEDQTPSAPVAPQADEDEERRLLYVALTRAARALFVSHSARRTLYGKSLALPPSPFLEQIRQFCRQSALAAHKQTQARPLSLLSDPDEKE